jgi:hypothetical protein
MKTWFVRVLCKAASGSDAGKEGNEVRLPPLVIAGEKARNEKPCLIAGIAAAHVLT